MFARDDTDNLIQVNMFARDDTENEIQGRGVIMWQAFVDSPAEDISQKIVFTGKLNISFDKADNRLYHIFYKAEFLNLIATLCKLVNIHEIILRDMTLGNAHISCTLKYTDIQDIALKLSITDQTKHSDLQRLISYAKQDATIFQSARDLIRPCIQHLELNSKDFCIERENHNSFADTIILDVVCNALLKTDTASVVKVYPAKWDNPNGVILVCYTKPDIVVTLPLEFRGFTVRHLKIHTISNDNFKVEESFKYKNILDELYFAKFQTLQSTISIHAMKLMEAHSNLEGIGASIFMSTKQGVIVPLSNYTYQPTPCIVLYCGSKSYTPYGENEFPTKLNGSTIDVCFPVDVQEGWFIDCMFQPSPDRLSTVMKPNSLKSYDQLVMGCCFSPHEQNTLATLGPFVSIRNMEGKEEVGVLTVAHAFGNQQHNIKVVQPGNDSYVPNVHRDHKFGEVFKTFDNSKLDAALLKIYVNRIPKKSMFIDIDDNDAYILQEAGINASEYSGEIMDATKLTSESSEVDHKILKVGARTGFTFGNLELVDTCVKRQDVVLGTVVNGICTQTMRIGQILVSSFANSAFLNLGDSGSAVFSYNRRERKLYCIGMAIGYIGSKDMCISGVVTPINYILSCFNMLQDIKVEMKVFSQPLEREEEEMETEEQQMGRDEHQMEIDEDYKEVGEFQ